MVLGERVVKYHGTKHGENSNYKHVPVFEILKDNTLVFSSDQSVKTFPQQKIGRTNLDFWTGIFKDFTSDLQKWNLDLEKEQWRYPIVNTSVSAVINLCDDLMMAACTGNYNICKYSPWLQGKNGQTPTPFSIGPENYQINPNLTKFSKNPLSWSHYQTLDQKVFEVGKGPGEGFPIGIVNPFSQNSGNIFCIRTQMAKC